MWILLRAAGIGAFVMLFASVAGGLVATTSALGARIPRATSTAVHQFTSTVGLLLLAVHIGLLLFDSFMPFRPSDVLVPLHSQFKPGSVALGVVAMYATVTVLATSWIRKQLGTKWWRQLHLLAVPAFTLALLHGIFAGSDASRPWMWWMYAASGLTVLFLLIARGLTVGLRPPRRAIPEDIGRGREGAEEPRALVGAGAAGPSSD